MIVIIVAVMIASSSLLLDITVSGFQFFAMTSALLVMTIGILAIISLSGTITKNAGGR